MCTAGPQPGTCPAQRAPLDLNGQIECQKICQIECQMECPGGHHSLQAKGSAAGAAQTRQHSFCCASDRHFSKMATFLQQVCKLFSKIGSYCPQLQIVGQKQRSQPALHSIIQVAIPTVLMDLGGRLRATCCKQATMPSTSRAATIRLKRRGPPQARLKSDSIVFAVHRTGIFPKWPPPCSKSPNFSPR